MPARLEKALETGKKPLAIYPAGGRTNLALARTYAELGETDQARKHLELTLKTWENADPDFKPADEARSLLQRLRNEAG